MATDGRPKSNTNINMTMIAVLIVVTVCILDKIIIGIEFMSGTNKLAIIAHYLAIMLCGIGFRYFFTKIGPATATVFFVICMMYAIPSVQLISGFKGYSGAVSNFGGIGGFLHTIMIVWLGWLLHLLAWLGIQTTPKT